MTPEREEKKHKKFIIEFTFRNYLRLTFWKVCIFHALMYNGTLHLPGRECLVFPSSVAQVSPKGTHEETLRKKHQDFHY